jgi:hypothetical protein
MKPVSMRKFVLGAAAVFLATISAAWVWAINGRMWFLDPEYAMWAAKIQMVRNCAPSETVILGDSKPVAGLIPRVMGDGVVNLGLGGASPIEGAYLVEDILKCPSRPKRVIVSYSPAIFINPEVYWTRSAAFGLLSFRQMEEVRLASQRLNDHAVYAQADGGFHLAGLFANYGRRLSLPSYYFPAMLNAGFVARKGRNDSMLEAVLDSRGHHFFGTASRTDWPSPDEPNIVRFQPSPLLHHYFERLISLLEDNGISVYFVGMPLNEVTAQAMRPGVRAEFAAYLDGVGKRHRNFRVLGEVLPVLPAEYFGDPDHLNPKGATMWSNLVAKRIAEATVGAQRPAAAEPQPKAIRAP